MPTSPPIRRPSAADLAALAPAPASAPASTRPPQHQRRAWLQSAWAGAAMLAWPVLQGCSSLGLPRVITLDQSELQRRLSAAFPMQRRLLEVVDLHLLRPRLQLLPEQNRLAVTLGLRSEDRLWRKLLQGELGFDAGLRYAPADASLRLVEVRVHTLVLDQPGPAGPDQAAGRPALSGLPARLARVVAEQLLEDLSLYQLPAERQAQLRQAGLQPGAVRVTERGIEVSLVPAA